MIQFHEDGLIPRNMGDGLPWIWVFGSNLSGIHGAGAARIARNNFDAAYGRGSGRTGEAYAIPTKDRKLTTLPLWAIKPYVDDFHEYVEQLQREPSKRQHRQFFVTRIGCGLAGYEDAEIAPMFAGMTGPLSFPEQWRKFL